MQRSSMWSVIGVVVLVIAAVVAFVLLNQQPGDEPPTASGSTEPSASASVAADLLSERWTVLFVGTDHNDAREANGDPVNADALLLGSLSADQSQLTLVSLPRDTVDLPLADGGTYDQKINQLYREQGIEALRGAMEALYGVPIDAHVVLDMEDMASLVEAVDGVDVDPPEPLSDPIVDLDIDAGEQELDADTALDYVRTRVDQDYGRMGRQQEVILSLVERLTDPDRAVDISSLLDGLESLETDLPLDELETLVELGRRARDAEVVNVLIEPPLITFEGDRDDGRGYILEPDVEAIRSEIGSLIGE